jgi:hypothetical protein
MQYSSRYVIVNHTAHIYIHKIIDHHYNFIRRLSAPRRNQLTAVTFETQVSFDLLMMAVTSGKERDEGEWRKIFMDAGCSHAPDLEGYSGQRTARCR